MKLTARAKSVIKVNGLNGGLADLEIPKGVDIISAINRFLPLAGIDIEVKASVIGGWVSLKDKTPTNAQSFYWVLFTDSKIKMCHLNDYRSLGGPVNYWQDLHHDDHLMDGTKYIEIIKPDSA